MRLFRNIQCHAPTRWRHFPPWVRPRNTPSYHSEAKCAFPPWAGNQRFVETIVRRTFCVRLYPSVASQDRKSTRSDIIVRPLSFVGWASGPPQVPCSLRSSPVRSEPPVMHPTLGRPYSRGELLDARSIYAIPIHHRYLYPQSTSTITPQLHHRRVHDCMPRPL